jgi:GNAT superfamily N-acetyltransferase/RimJ/RimL family protein N-acetyltransferase
VAPPARAGLAVKMHIEQVDLTDTEKIRECFEVYHAAQRVDEPEEPWFTEQPFRGWITVGWDGSPREVWLAVDQYGSAAGWYRLHLPSRENLDQAGLDLVVHPAERQRGAGLALLRHAAGRATAHGRAVFNGGTRNGSAGEAFARSVGAKPGLVEVQRVLDLGRLEKGKLARLRGPAELAAAGYSLESWVGPIPEEFLGDVAALYDAMGDAPRDPEIAHEEWDAQRVRESINRRQHYGLRDYTLVARHDDTGELAALSEMAVDPADPGWGFQMNTVVIRKHRGHRLGLLTKIAMMELLATTEPQLERISTWNAEVNEHMIAVNEVIGYTVFGQPVTGSRLDVTAVPGSPG